PLGEPVHTPGAGQEVALETGDDDYVTFQPHAGVHDAGNQEEHPGRGTYFVEPERLGQNDVTHDKRPVITGIRAGHAVPHHRRLELVRAVPGEEGLHSVAVCDDQAGCKHQLAAILQVTQRDEVLHAIQIAEWDGQDEHHGKAGVNGA